MTTLDLRVIQTEAEARWLDASGLKKVARVKVNGFFKMVDGSRSSNGKKQDGGIINDKG
ncbi:MAG: hypothetical protein AAGF55_04585 [Pseudomonadota bacterium]